jgi:hypothetical protein
VAGSRIADNIAGRRQYMIKLLLTGVMSLALLASAHAETLGQFMIPTQSLKEATKLYDDCVFAWVFAGETENTARETCKNPANRAIIYDWWASKDMEWIRYWMDQDKPVRRH